MPVFVDTSAFYATLDTADQGHQAAVQTWHNLEESGELPLATNYVLVETVALVGRRLGFQSVRAFQSQLVPLVAVHWVDQSLHEVAAAAMLIAGLRQLSLVDCVSFEVMRRLGLQTAFAFDAHFATQGFRMIP